MSSCDTPRYPTNAMTSFSHVLLNLTIALFIGALSWVWRSCRSFYPRWAWRACEIFDWTRSTTPTHTPPTPRLVCLRSFSLSSWVARKFSHCSRCLTHPPPRPSLLLPQPPPPLPPSPLLPFAPFASPHSPPLPSTPLLLLPLRPVESLSLSLEGPIPPLGLLMTCPLHPLFGFS